MWLILVPIKEKTHSSIRLCLIFSRLSFVNGLTQSFVGKLNFARIFLQQLTANCQHFRKQQAFITPHFLRQSCQQVGSVILKNGFSVYRSVILKVYSPIFQECYALIEQIRISQDFIALLYSQVLFVRLSDVPRVQEIPLCAFGLSG